MTALEELQPNEVEIELLRKEYRTRLISDVVTGKLDVQEATAGQCRTIDRRADKPDGGDPRSKKLLRGGA